MTSSPQDRRAAEIAIQVASDSAHYTRARVVELTKDGGDEPLHVIVYALSLPAIAVRALIAAHSGRMAQPCMKLVARPPMEAVVATLVTHANNDKQDGARAQTARRALEDVIRAGKLAETALTQMTTRN